MKKRILLKAPILSQSGYGEHSRFIYRSLKRSEDVFDIYIEPLNWGQTGWIWEDSKERKEMDKHIGKFYQLMHQKTQNHFDICVHVDLPTAWKRVATTMVGVTAGIECDAISPTWLQPSFSEVDKIIVPSQFSKDGFINSIDKYREMFDEKTKEQSKTLKEKFENKINVINYPIKDFQKVDLDLNFETNFNFLMVTQWGPRKNIDETIRMFYKEFSNESDVGLVLKTNLARNSIPDRHHVKKKIDLLKQQFPEAKCKVYLLHGEMTDDEIHSLYTNPKIKAMINFGHGEGYGLPLFEAAYCGLPVITHDFGGQKDFLYAPKKDKKGVEKTRPHFTKVLYKQAPVQKEAIWNGVIEADAEWAFVDMRSAATAMKECMKDYGLSISEAKRLKEFLLNKEEDVYNITAEVIYGEEIKQINFKSVKLDQIPKISFITSVYKGEEFIEGFMEDITKQTIFKDKCELVLVNCNSPENEEETILKYQRLYPDNIKYIKLDNDPGIYGAWNLAIKESTGEFISNANLDDRKAPDFAEKLAKLLVMKPEIDCVYTDNLLTQTAHENFLTNSSNGQVYPVEEFSLEAMLRGNPPHCMPMWRKLLHEKNGLFNETYKSAGDWEFWLRCAFNNSVYFKFNQNLGLYYFNPNGISTSKENLPWKKQEEFEVFKKYQKLYLERNK